MERCKENENERKTDGRNGEMQRLNEGSEDRESTMGGKRRWEIGKMNQRNKETKKPSKAKTAIKDEPTTI